MKYIFTIFCVFFVIACAACDDEKKITGDILVSMYSEDSQSRLYRMTEDEHLTDIHPFDDGWGAFNARWSPDGRQIVFATGKNATTNGPSLYVMNSDGSHAKPLKEIDYGYTKIPLSGSFPAWSPDGKKIAYTFCNCETSSNSEVYVIDLETKTEMNLTNNPAGDGQPIWSPDGSKILFLSNRDSDAGVYIMDNNGNNQIRLAKGTPPAWNANDSLINFFSDSSFHTLNIFTMQEKEAIPVHIEGESMPIAITWSPDARNILFITFVLDGSAKQRLYQMDIENQIIKRRLTNYDQITDVDWYKH